MFVLFVLGACSSASHSPEAVSSVEPARAEAPPPEPVGHKVPWRALPSLTVEGRATALQSVMIYDSGDSVTVQLHSADHRCQTRAQLTETGDEVGVSLTVETETDASGASVTTAVDYMSNVEVVLPQWDYDGKSARAVLPRMELQRWGKNLVLEGRLDADVCPASSTVDAD